MKVVIIGAGPAGCAAAITLCQRGVRPILIEREEFPRYRPGESLHPGVEPLLRQLGAWELVERADYLRHNGIWVEWDGPRRFVPFGSDADSSWSGFQATRSHFDSLLLQVARQYGTQFMQAAARCVLTNGDRICSIGTSDGEIQADYVLDASGTARWLSRQLNLGCRFYSIPLIARYGYAKGSSAADLPAIVADDLGWTWFAQVDENTFHWTRVTATKCRLPTKVPVLFASMSTIRFRGANVQWRLESTTAGQNWFLMGDAACYLDPSSSHGVLRAIMTGIMAADMVSRAGSPVEYDRWLKTWFREDAAHMRNAYSAANLFGFKLKLVQRC